MTTDTVDLLSQGEAHLFSATKETSTHVTNHAAVSLPAFLFMIVPVCQIFVAARHSARGYCASRGREPSESQRCGGLVGERSGGDGGDGGDEEANYPALRP